MTRTYKIGTGLLVVVLALAGIVYWRAAREIVVQTAPVESDVEVRVFGIGNVEAQVLSRVGFQIAGKIVELTADQGDIVPRGALLAKLDDQAQRAKLTKSDAALRQAAANLTKVQAQRDRSDVVYQQKKSINLRRQSLAGRGTVSVEVAEDAQAAEEIAHGDLKVIEADAAVAGVLQDDAAAQRKIDAVLLDQHELRAPFDARVIARHRELGSVANPGEAVFTLIEPDSIWVRAYVDETVAGGLAIGQKAFVRLRSEPDRTYETETVRIDQESDRVTEERRVYVRCRLCGSPHQLRFLGEQAEIEIVKKIIPSGRFVPLKYVEGYDGRGGMVWLLESGRLAKRRVMLGERLLDGRIQVTSELPAQTGIVVVGDGLREGRAARAATGS